MVVVVCGDEVQQELVEVDGDIHVDMQVALKAWGLRGDKAGERHVHTRDK